MNRFNSLRILQHFKWFGSFSRERFNNIKLLLIILVFFLVPNSIFGADYTQCMRQVAKYKKWNVVEFKVPLTGLFIASRTAAEDRANNATLAFTFVALPDLKCKESMEVIFDLQEAVPNDLNKEDFIDIEIDNRFQLHLLGRVAASAGDHFVFFQIKKPNFVKELFNGKRIFININDIGTANFSLDDFENAWKKASEACRKFELDDLTR